jgi:hypothetical protein
MQRYRIGSWCAIAVALGAISSSAVGQARFGSLPAGDKWEAPAVRTSVPERRATGRGGTVLYVDDDAAPGGDGLAWTTAFTTIEPALAAAGDGTEVRVAGGTFVPPIGGWTIPERVSLVGGFAGLANPGNPGLWDPEAYETVLTGDVNGDDAGGVPAVFADNRRVIVAVLSRSTVRGVTVTAARSDPGGAFVVGRSCTIESCRFVRNGLGGVEDGVDYVGDQGPAVRVMDNSNDMRDCVFIGNTSVELGSGAINGGAMLVDRFGDVAPMSGCLFEANRTLSGAVGEPNPGGPPGRSSSGAAIYIRGYVEMYSCDFVANVSANQGGALFVAGSFPRCYDCRFVRNRAIVGGAVAIRGGDLDVFGSLLVANEATSDVTWSAGGAVFIGDFSMSRTYSLRLVNSVVYGNRAADGQAGGIWSINEDYTRMENSILWANEDRGGMGASAQLLVYDEPTAFMTRPNIIMGWPEPTADSVVTGVRGLDPMFIDPEGPDGILGTDDDDFRVAYGSPCIDAGWNILGGVDLGGRPRVVDDPATPDWVSPAGEQNGPTDIGVYEYEEDCDGSGVVDSVELMSGTLDDADANGVPDVCQDQTDCDGNRTADFIDIALGTAPDCNGNGVPDACDIALGFSADADGGGVPDECEPITLFVDGGAARDAGRVIAGTSWADPLPDLQAAFARAHTRSAPTEIWVRAGVYTPNEPGSGGIDAFRLGPGMGVYGGFAGGETQREQRDPEVNVTVLDADGAPHVLVASLADGAVLDGFVVTGGTGEVADGPYSFFFTGDPDPVIISPDSFGGGIFVIGGSPLIRACRFEGNTAPYGAAAFCARNAAPVFEDCAFVGNGEPENGSVTLFDIGFPFEAGDEVYERFGLAPAATATIDGCDFGAFTGQDVLGGTIGAVSHAVNRLEVRGCRFEGVDGAAWVIGSTATLPGNFKRFEESPPGPIESVPILLVENCEIVGNAPARAVVGSELLNVRGPLDEGYDVYPIVRVVGSAISSNPATAAEFTADAPTFDPGLGVYRPIGALTLCTVAGNARVVSDDVSATTAWQNCVIAANDVVGAIEPFIAPLVDSHRQNCIEGVVIPDDPPHVVGNIADDPMFVDRLGPDGMAGTGDEDFRLVVGSPAIDSGDNGFVPASLVRDLDNNPRVADEPGTPDTGAPPGEPAYVDRGAYEAPGSACRADLDGDDDTDIFDFAILADTFGATGLEPFTGGDINGDGNVDTFDFADLASDFGCGLE